MARNNDTYAPSTARWSQLTPRMPVEWMAMDSDPSGCVTTTGRRAMPSVARIATCGWLMIGTVK